MPVVCVRLTEEAVAALEAQAARRGVDRSAWLRDVVLRHLNLPRNIGAVEAISPPPAALVDPLVPGDRLRVVDPASPIK